VLGWRSEDLAGDAQHFDLVHPADRDGLREKVLRITATGEPFRHEYRLRHRDGHWLDIEAHGHFVRDPAQRGRHMIGFLRDVTERKRAEAHQRMLIDELNHRVKNTLAAVQSIAAQTLRGRGPVADLGDMFMSRLMSLAQTHELLTRSRWEGATVREVLEMELSPYRGEAGRARANCRGPHVRLGPKSVQALGMAFHELATNAAKYGALSVAGGHVEVTWTIQPDAAGRRRLELCWAETGGPEVSPPARRGFGTRMIEGGLAGELRGEVRLAFEPDGVQCLIGFPLGMAEASA
jgi:PAS domain S-box-containing protein